MQPIDAPRSPAESASKEKLFANFMWMSVCFSINHATVTAMISLATSSLGSQLGNAQTAMLYTFYTLTALFGANIIVSFSGYKWGIVSGLGVYVAYVGSFIIADLVPSVKTPAAYLGGALGGVAAGFLWSAQGPYFAKNAELYAIASNGQASEDAINETKQKWAAYFAIPYLGFEVFFKLIQTAIGATGTGTLNLSWGKNMIYVINTVAAVAAAIGCSCIMDMPAPKDQKPVTSETIVEKASSALKLLFTDPKMPLMMGMNVAFGVVSAYLNGYLIGQVATRYLGPGYAGYLAAIIATVAAVLSVPTVLGLIKPEWKKYYMVFGPLCFGLVTGLPLLVGYKTLGNWGGLVSLFVLHGIGRGVWEATNKALFAEYFAYDTLGAFSNIIIQNGAASAIAFFVNAYGGTTPSCPEYTVNATSTTACCDKFSDVAPKCNGDSSVPYSPFCLRNTNDCEAYASEAWAGTIFSVLAIVGFMAASVLQSRGVKTWGDLNAKKAEGGYRSMDDELDSQGNPVGS